MTIALTNMTEGTSFGAALTAWMLADKKSVDEIGREFTIETSPFAPGITGDLDAYVKAWRDVL